MTHPYTVNQNAYTQAEISQLRADAKEAGRKAGLQEAAGITLKIMLSQTGQGHAGPISEAIAAIEEIGFAVSTVPVPSGFDQGAKEAFDSVERTVCEMFAAAVQDGNDLRAEAYVDLLVALGFDRVGLKERVAL